jgi:hypothetical protein
LILLSRGNWVDGTRHEISRWLLHTGGDSSLVIHEETRSAYAALHVGAISRA